jgi:hypothetical protein
MQHELHVFLVVGWIVASGRNHPILSLPEYRRLVPLQNNRSGIFSITLVDEPRFVKVHFEEVARVTVCPN